MKPARRAERSNFFWQGFLILFPAFLLAGAGILAIAKDWAATERDVAGEASKIASTLATRIPGALLDDFADVDSAQALEEAARKRHSGAVALAFSHAGEWLKPKPSNEAPRPNALGMADLPPALQNAWADMEQSLEATPTPELLPQLQSLQGSMEGHPLRAWARYKEALLLRSLENAQASRTLLETLSLEPDSAVSPSGIPIAVLAALAFPTNSPPPSLLIQRLAGYAESNPGAFADRIVEWIRGVAPAAFPMARAALDYNGNAREFALEWVRSGAPMPSETAWHQNPVGERFLMLAKSIPASAPGSQGEGTMLLFLPREAVLGKLSQLSQEASLPKHLGVELHLEGGSVAASPPGALLAEASLGAGQRSTHHGWLLPAATARVFLANPELFRAGLRRRAWILGGLVGLASVSVVAGYAGARRAFWRERQLGEMRANFVSSVSHELRAPIASMRLMAEELQDLSAEREFPASPAGTRSKSEEYHRFMVMECRRLSSLIENVLDFARREQGREQSEFEPTDLGRLIAGTAGSMSALAAGAGVGIETDIPEGEQVAEVDAPGIQRALINLIDNALKHSPPGSMVRIELRQTPVGLARIIVRDQGAGIPAAELERIFERFYRRGSELRRETQGIGLGLSIVRLVAETHGGRAWAESALGQGSSFFIEIPGTRTEANTP